MIETSSWRPGPTARSGFANLLWAAAVAAILVTSWATLARPIQKDLEVYVGSVSLLVRGGSLYDFHSTLGPFTYPPFAGLVLLPVAVVRDLTLRVVWVLLTVAAVVVLARLAVRALRPSTEAGRLLLPAAILLLMVSWPVQSNFKFGQLSIFLGLVVVADLLVLDRHRAQGVLTGLAAALKLTPLIFLPYLWITGRRRAAWFAAGAFATATGLAFVALPHESVVFLTKRLFEATRMESVAWNPNQSLYGALLRTSWPPGVVGTLWAALSVVVVGVGLWRARRAWAAGQPLLSVAIVGATSLVASPITWAHHQIWLVLAVFGTFTADGRANRWIRALMVVTIAQGVIPLPVSGGPVRWFVVNNRLVLSVAVACFLPFVAAGGRSGPEGEEAAVPSVEGDGEAERLREPRAREGVLEGT